MPAFIDTNVLVYCTDAAAPAKQRRARALLDQVDLLFVKLFSV